MRAGGAVARAAGWAFASHSRHLCDQVGTHHSNPSESANRAMSCTTTPTFHRPLLPTPPPIPPTDSFISSSTPSRSPPRPEGRLERLLMSKSSYLSSCALSAKVNFGSRARSSYVMRAVSREFAASFPSSSSSSSSFPLNIHPPLLSHPLHLSLELDLLSPPPFLPPTEQQKKSATIRRPPIPSSPPRPLGIPITIIITTMILMSPTPHLFERFASSKSIPQQEHTN